MEGTTPDGPVTFLGFTIFDSNKELSSLLIQARYSFLII